MPAHIADALRCVRQGELVFGPATDGGYWLIGTRNIDRYYGLFRNVRWSTSNAFDDTRANVVPWRRLDLAARLSDVDDAIAFKRS